MYKHSCNCNVFFVWLSYCNQSSPGNLCWNLEAVRKNCICAITNISKMYIRLVRFYLCIFTCICTWTMYITVSYVRCVRIYYLYIYCFALYGVFILRLRFGSGSWSVIKAPKTHKGTRGLVQTHCPATIHSFIPYHTTVSRAGRTQLMRKLKITRKTILPLNTLCCIFWLKLSSFIYTGNRWRLAQYKWSDYCLITVCVFYHDLVVTLIALNYPILPAFTPIVQGRRDTFDYTVTYIFVIKISMFWIFHLKRL